MYPSPPRKGCLPGQDHLFRLGKAIIHSGDGSKFLDVGPEEKEALGSDLQSKGSKKVLASCAGHRQETRAVNESNTGMEHTTAFTIAFLAIIWYFEEDLLYYQ